MWKKALIGRLFCIYMWQKTNGGRLGAILFACLALLAQGCASLAQVTTLDVTSFGAVGDALNVDVQCVSNSTSVLFTNPVSSADVGKVIEIFGAGPATTPTNNQDFVGTIMSVAGQTATVSPMPQASGTFLATYGTNNSPAFQACINAAQGTNVTINIPAGTYLLLSAQALNPNFVMSGAFETHPSVAITNGGIDFVGAGRDAAILLGCGAWQKKGAWAYRGFLVAFQGPTTRDYPVTFENLTMDGGVPIGYTGNGAWPANTNNGDGWDVTHDAVLDNPPLPVVSQRVFRNCNIRNWRGEQFKGGTPGPGLVLITNCSFCGGDATAINLTFTHAIFNCCFSNLIQIEEFYEGYSTNACFFLNSLVTNVTEGIVVNGVISNSPAPLYVISNNVLAPIFGSIGSRAISTTPGQNITIVSNQFVNWAVGVASGIAGYQGNAYGNSNILATGNFFNNCANVFLLEGSGMNNTLNMLVLSNTAISCGAFGSGWGWCTNVSFIGNVGVNGSGGLDSSLIQGQLFYDDPSNRFPFYNDDDFNGVTNLITYGHGMHQYIWVSQTNSVWALDDTQPQMIPPGAILVIANAQNLQTQPTPLYSSATMAGTPTTLQPGDSVRFQWTNGVWQLTGLLPRPTPPSSLGSGQGP